MTKKFRFMFSLAVILTILLTAAVLLVELSEAVILGAWAGCLKEFVTLFTETFVIAACRILPCTTGIALFLTWYCYKTR